MPVAGLDQLGQFAGVSGPLRRDDANLGQVAPQPIEQLRALRNQHLARLVTHQRGLILQRAMTTNRIDGLATASQIAAASAASFFCRRTYGFT
jgi:hypothetical protein